MQSNPQKLWIPNPSAAVVSVGTPGTDFEGEVRIVDQINILAASVRKCTVTCASPCVREQWTIEFNDVDFGDCNACGKSVGFQIELDRHPDFDNQTYFEYAMRKPYVYQGEQDGVVSGATLATWFATYINSLYNQNDQHDQFLIEVSVVGDTLTIILPCSGLLTYTLKGIYQIQNNNLLDAELPVFTETVSGVEAKLSREKLLRDFPQEVGHVFGEAPRDQWMWCQNICVIYLKGCIDPCSDFFDNQNSGHLHTGATPFDLMIYVDSAAPGYAAFITALNNAFTACDLDTAPGNGGAQAAYNGAGTVLNLSNIVFDAAGTPFTLQVGPVTVNVVATSGANLAAEINALFAGTAVYAAPNLTISGALNALAAPDGFITLSPHVNTNYVGE